MKTIMTLKSRKTIDIENAIAAAYRQGVIAGIRGARGEKIPEQTVTICSPCSIQGSDAADAVNGAFVMAIAANPAHNESTVSLLKNY